MIINASPLIIFGKLNKMQILKKLYKKIVITPEVYNEVVLKGLEKGSKDALIVKGHITNNDIAVVSLEGRFSSTASRIQEIYDVHIGEAETIALALQLREKEAIIDEINAREAARAFGIMPIGSLRVLLVAYKKNLINKDEINTLINEMENSKYRFSPKVLIEFWELFNKIKRKE